MATANNIHSQSSQAQGFDMRTMARKSFANPSLANGVHPNTTTATNASPGAVLGTGANTDLYTPGIEAV